MNSTRSSGVGNCLFLRSRGWGKEHQERKKIAKLPETQITHTRGGRLSLAPFDMQYPWERAVLLSFTVTWSSNKGSVDCFRREKLKRLATFDSLSVQMRLAARSRIHSRTIVCYLGGVWRPLESLERIYGGFPSVDPSGRFAGVPNLGKPSIERENRLRYNLVGYSNDRFFPHTNPYISNVTQQLMWMVTDARN